MKISSTPNIFFQKKLIAKCNVIDTCKQKPCKIFELDYTDSQDIKYYRKLHKDKNWEDYFYIDNISSDIEAGVETRYFVMEDENEHCLAICEVDECYPDQNELLYIETAPACCSENKKRTLKYVGESLITFLVGLAKSQEKEKFAICDPRDQAVLFYKKCGFKINDFDDNMTMKNSDFTQLLDRNKAHTGQKIEYIG